MDCLADRFGDHIQKRRLGLSLLQVQDEMEKAITIHQRHGYHSIGREKSRLLLDTTISRGVRISHHRFAQHLTNLLGVRLAKDRIIDAAQSRNNCWLLEYG